MSILERIHSPADLKALPAEEIPALCAELRSFLVENLAKTGGHLEVLESFLDFVPGAGFTVMGLDYSPIKGPEGNIEYLGYLRKGTHPAPELDPAAIVEHSHGALAHGKESGV